MSKRYQLRMYTIRPGELAEWMTEWREHVLPLRRSHGFEVLGPWMVEEDDLFVWMIGHDDFEAADRRYYESPERAALDPDPARHIDETKTWLMDAAD